LDCPNSDTTEWLHWLRMPFQAINLAISILTVHKLFDGADVKYQDQTNSMYDTPGIGPVAGRRPPEQCYYSLA